MNAQAALVLGLLIAAFVVLVLLAWAFQRRLIYLPISDSVPSAPFVLPGAQDVAFTTQDGLQLSGWFVQPAGDEALGVVLVFNGNAGNRAYRAPLAAALAEAGFAVLLFDYRGYGGNPGSPSESGLMADARAAQAYVQSELGYQPARTIYFGESLGAAVALALALERPPAALVLRSPFTSLADVGRLHYPFLPVSLLLKDRYASLEKIGSLARPVLIVAGARDSVIPAVQSRRLFDAAPEPKRFALHPQADHNDFELLAGRWLIETVLDFLRSSAGYAPSAGA